MTLNDLFDRKIEINGTAQQGKKETLEFHNIPNQYDEKGNEDTTAIITDFCKKISRHED